MKYIIFKKGELVQPVIFGEHISHSDISLSSEWVPVSGGFCYPDKDIPGVVSISFDSCVSDMNLEPHVSDGHVLGMALKNKIDAIHYLDQGHAVYPAGDKSKVKKLRRWKQTGTL